MIAYVCKYTPIEMLTSMGAELVRVEPEVTNFNEADALMHPNVCSYAKAVLEDMAAKDYEGIVLTTCCDSIRRLYDTLKSRYPDKFVYLLDVPRVVNDYSTGLYAERILALAKAYADFRNMTGNIDDKVFKELGNTIKVEQDSLKKTGNSGSRAQPDEKAIQTHAPQVRVGILGARCPQSLLEILDEHGVRVAFNMTCTGMERASSLWDRMPELPETSEQGSENATGSSQSDLMKYYASALLGQIPCMRMVNGVNRERYLEGFESELDGVIYHTVKFCDSYAYEYTKLHKEGKVRMLKLETDLTKQCEGQIRTRVEAFIEALEAEKRVNMGKAEQMRNASNTEQLQRPDGNHMSNRTHDKQADKDILVMGVDSGSTSTNAVILNGKREIIASATVRTGAKTSESSQKVLEETLNDAGRKLGRKITREDITVITSTGYGRVSIPYADRNVTEISCHARGALYFNPKVRTILDIGGQDSKAIRLKDDGTVADFVMNDKCAAGTGRFLEAMARTLEVDIKDLGPISLESKEEIEISSMCTVFAESEVISLISQNKEKADIARGVHKAIAGKAYALMERVGLSPEYMMTGGVARNKGVVKALNERLGADIYICDTPDIVGAVGAALYALGID